MFNSRILLPVLLSFGVFRVVLRFVCSPLGFQLVFFGPLAFSAWLFVLLLFVAPLLGFSDGSSIGNCPSDLSLHLRWLPIGFQGSHSFQAKALADFRTIRRFAFQHLSPWGFAYLRMFIQSLGTSKETPQAASAANGSRPTDPVQPRPGIHVPEFHLSHVGQSSWKVLVM